MDEIITSEQAATIPINTAFSNAVDMESLIGSFGLIYVPAWTAASIGFYGCGTADGTFVPIYDELGAVAQVTGIKTATAGLYRMPVAMNGVRWLKLWSQNAGVSVNQGAQRNCIVYAKG